MRTASPLRRVLATATATALIGTGLLAGTASAADQNLSVAPTYSNNSAAGTTTLHMTTTGTDFQTGASTKLTLVSDGSITINNSGAPSTVNPLTPKTFDATVPLTQAAPGVYNVTVTNPGIGGAVYSCSSCFTVTSSVPTATAFHYTAGSNPVTYTVNGTNFATGSKVTFAVGGVVDTNVTFANPAVSSSGTVLTGTFGIAPAVTGGTYDVIVTNTDGKKGTCSACLVIPKITGVRRANQADGAQAALGYGVTNTDVVVKGVGFTAGTTFDFVSSTNNNTNLVTINSRTFDAVNKTFTLNVSVADPNTNSDNNDPLVQDSYYLASHDVGNGGFNYLSALLVNPRPKLDATAPFDNRSPGQGSSSFPIVMTGTGFQTGMTTSFSPSDGITVVSTTRNSATQATVVVNVASGTPLTAHSVKLTNPDLGTNNDGKTLTPSAAPKITSSSPTNVGKGTTSVVIRFNGSGFRPAIGKNNAAASQATDYVAPKVVFLDHAPNTGWDQVGSVTYDTTNYTWAQATMAIPANAPAGPQRIGFLDHNGSLVECFTASNGACFTIDDLAVNSVSPSLGTNDGPISLTVTGSGFLPGAVAKLTRDGQSDIVGSTTAVTATSITATFDLNGAAPGNAAWTMRVTNTDGSTGAKSAAFSVAGGSPTITSISPSTLAAGNKAAVLTVNGTELAKGAVLVFSACGLDNTCNPQNVSAEWISKNQMKFTLDTTTATQGFRSLQVKNTDSATSPAANCQLCLTITPAPTLSGTPISPASRAAGSATVNVTVNGSNFNGTPTVAFTGGGITTGASTLGAGGTSFTFPLTVAPDAVANVRSFTVTNGDGGQVTCTSCFTVLAAPTVVMLTPNTQKRGTGPTNVIVKGTRFVSGAAVTFSGTGITATTTFVDAQTLTAAVTVTAGATPLGAHDVTVTNAPAGDGGTATLVKAFSIGDVPGAPTGLTAARGDQLVNLSWTAPSSDGGLPITGYTVTVTPAAGTVAVNGTTAQVSGLTNGTQYAFTVKATNDAGAGPASGSASATPATVPGAPTNATASAGDGEVTVSWTAPASNGGDPITQYKVLYQPGNAQAAQTTNTSITFPATNGQAVKFAVIAVNTVGISNPSNTTSPVTPLPAVPGPPTNLTASATAAAGQVDLSWTAPSGQTLTPITQYTVTVSPASGSNVGTTSYPVDRTQTTASVTGLTNGVVYTFQVKASTSAGAGPASGSASATPYGVPGAVTGLSGTAGDATVSASWTAPASNGSAITGYTATLTPGGTTKDVTGTTVSFSGLTNGTAYTVGVVAKNARGAGPSTSTGTLTPKAGAKPATSLTLNQPTSRVLRGQNIRLGGVVTRTSTGAPFGKVVIKVKNDQGVISTVTTVTPASNGAYTYVFAPAYNGNYTAGYLGDAANAPSISPTRRSLVAVRIGADTTTGPATTNAIIRGGAIPNKPGQIVSLYRVSSTGALTLLARTRLNSQSIYQFSIRLSRGNHLLQVGIANTPGNDHGEYRFIAKRT